MPSTIVDASGIDGADRSMSLRLLESGINRLAGIDALDWGPVHAHPSKRLKRAELCGGIWFKGKSREASLELEGDVLSLIIQWDGIVGRDIPFAIRGDSDRPLCDGKHIELLLAVMQGWKSILGQPTSFLVYSEIDDEIEELSLIGRGLLAGLDGYSKCQILPYCYGAHEVIFDYDFTETYIPRLIFDSATGMSSELVGILDGFVRDRVFITDYFRNFRQFPMLPYISIGPPPPIEVECLSDPMARMRAIAALPPGVRLLQPRD